MSEDQVVRVFFLEKKKFLKVSGSASLVM